jgi:Tat protein translocase TatB subunit
MFGIGMPEMLMILAIALIVIGPKKLPGLAKSLGRAMREFKRATSDFKETLAVDNDLTDVKKAFDDINTDIKDAVDITSAAKDTPSSDAGVAEIQTTENHTESSDADARMDDLKQAFEGLNPSDAATAESDSDEIEEWDRNKSATDDTENKKE